MLQPLCILAVGLTAIMFLRREVMLGFPCAIFWAILGGFAYTESLATWDMYYFLFFASLGMAIFSMYSAFALREKRDSLGEESMSGKAKRDTMFDIDDEEN